MFLYSKLNNNTKVIRIGIIGCGKFISMFLAQYRFLNNIEVDSIVDKDTVVGADTTGIHLKILAPKGLIRVNQGSGNGVATGFTAHGESMAVKVVPITASE